VKTTLSLLIATVALWACSSQTPPTPGPADQVANAPEAQPPTSTTDAPSGEANSSEDTYAPPEPQQVVSIFEDQPDTQPPPIEVDWAPPPMLVEPPPPPPEPTYIWTGGYWGWHGRWVWVHGRWAAPPRPGYRWQQPYYDHRGGHIVFVGGFWARPGVEFVAPAAGVAIALAAILPGVIAGPPPRGPEGVFIPPPPGSRPGLIVPAFVGCPPAVVMGAPPAIGPGMRVTHNHDTTINNVTIIAPASAVATHVAVNSSVPSAAHLAAAQTPVVRMLAPQPATTRPVPPYSAAHSIALPAAQSVRAEVSPQLDHPVSAMHEAAQPGELSQPGAATPIVSQDLVAQQQQVEQQRAAQAKAAQESAAQEKAAQQRAEQEQAAQARLAAEAATEASQKAAAAANAERSQQQAVAEAGQKAAQEEASKKKAAEEAAARKAAEKNRPPQ
jgi:hypothetical protein